MKDVQLEQNLTISICNSQWE